MAGLEHRRHLCLGFRQHDDQRFAPIGRKAVALVGRDLLWLPEQDVRRRHRTKRGDHFGLPRRARGQVRLEGGIHSESSGKIYWFYWQIIPFAALQRGRSNPAFCDLSKAKLCCAKVRARRTTARQTDVRFRPDFVALCDQGLLTLFMPPRCPQTGRDARRRCEARLVALPRTDNAADAPPGGNPSGRGSGRRTATLQSACGAKHHGAACASHCLRPDPRRGGINSVNRP
ncbi:protein of unknown function [Thiomonas sp. CB2]|nr:protein of unknown function [Thiomonas sp. CB2]